MSKLILENPKIALVATLGAGVAAIGFTLWYKQKLENTPPKEWRRVGELADLICYPVKSCGPVRINQIQCNLLGMEENHLRDRVFMIVTDKGHFVDARLHPKLVRVMPKIQGDTLSLSTSGMNDISIDMKHLYSLKPKSTILWDEKVDVVDCGDEIAKWISQCILNEDKGLRLAFYPKNYTTRNVPSRHKGWPLIKTDGGALQNDVSFMMINESSINDLNTKLEIPVTALRYRPNFVVKGAIPFDEDNWKWVRIGQKTIFRNVMPCSRCSLTNIDPETGIKSADNPLKTLRSYRKAPGFGESPLMGIHLGIRVPGIVALGDGVYVA